MEKTSENKPEYADLVAENRRLLKDLLRSSSRVIALQAEVEKLNNKNQALKKEVSRWKLEAQLGSYWD